MFSRSVIGVMHGSVCKTVTCDWDGHLDDAGQTLQQFYNNSVLANQLVAHGNMSNLGYDVKHTRFHEDQEFQTFLSYDDLFRYHVVDQKCKYLYIMKKNRWYYATADQPALKPLLPVVKRWIEEDIV
jgi:hypothetical protein